MYEQISSTAHVIAHIRSFTNIPYAGTIALLAHAREETAAFYHRDDFDVDLDGMQKLAPWIEQRFYSLHQRALRQGHNDYVELASGLSPGGILRTEESENRYLEVDLPEMIAQKKKIAEQLEATHPNLGFAALSVLDGAALLKAVQAAYPEMHELTVLNEGLLQYLTHEEKRTVADNVRRLLRFRGGTWVTTDIVYKNELLEGYEQNDKTRRVRQIMFENTGRDMVECAFENEAEAHAFMESAGFFATRYWQKGRFDSPRASHLEHQQVWVMSSR